MALLHDLDSLIAGAGALPGEVEDEKAEDAEDDLGEGLAELVFQFKLFGSVVLEGGVHGAGDFVLWDDPDDPEGEGDNDDDGEDRDENVRGGAVGVFGPEAYLFDSLMDGLGHVDGSLAFAAGSFRGAVGQSFLAGLESCSPTEGQLQRQIQESFAQDDD